MAFSRLEKAMALLIGIDITTPGTSRALARQLVTRIAPLTVPAAAAAGHLPQSARVYAMQLFKRIQGNSYWRQQQNAAAKIE